MFGVYNRDDDEMYLMNKDQVWNYLQKESPLFQHYSVVTNGESVVVSEVSAGANGKLSEQSLEDFYYEFQDWLIIRPIQEIE